MTIELSNISPNFSDLVSQLQAELSTKDSWKDRLTTSTGQTIIELLAAIGAYSQYSIESAFQEDWPQSAKNASSIYAASNFMGVRVNRKSPASITLQLTASGTVTLPVNSQFVGAGTYWFNRNSYTLGTTPTSVILYQGQIQTHEFKGLGSDFQAFVSTEPSFVVSNTDVTLAVNGVSIPVTSDGLWTKPGSPGVQDLTLPSGQLMLLFGNNTYGTLIGTNDNCLATYALTMGIDGANIPTIGQVITLGTDATVTGVCNSQASGGGAETNYVVYKNITPALFGAFSNSVTASQYKRLPLQYPGVLDAQTYAQREISPFALTWMNVIKVCLLTSAHMSDTDWQDFETWYQERTMYSTRIYRQDPVPSPITVTARVFCKNFANLTQVTTNSTDAINKLFQLRQGIIGLDVYRSDIINAIMQADSNIEYVILDSPTFDLILSSFAVGYPRATIVPSDGILPIGNYDYAVSAVSSSGAGGESAPVNWVSAPVTVAGSGVTLVWDAVPNATEYHIWGRLTSGTLGQIGSVSASTLTFFDTGRVEPVGPLLVQSTLATVYPNLITNNITVAYSSRDNRS